MTLYNINKLLTQNLTYLFDEKEKYLKKLIKTFVRNKQECIQLRAKNTPLVNKHYENEVTLREEDLPLKCCLPLKMLMYFKKGFKSCILWIKQGFFKIR